MTQQELLNALETKFFKVGIPSAQGNPTLGLQWYLVKVFDKTGDAVRDQNIAFYEDMVTGDCYWSPSEPKEDPVVDQFKMDLLAKIAQIQAAQADLKMCNIVTSDSTGEKAIAETYWLVAGKLEKRGYGAYRKADNSLDFIEIA